MKGFVILIKHDFTKVVGIMTISRGFWLSFQNLERNKLNFLMLIRRTIEMLTSVECIEKTRNQKSEVLQQLPYRKLLIFNIRYISRLLYTPCISVTFFKMKESG